MFPDLSRIDAPCSHRTCGNSPMVLAGLVQRRPEGLLSQKQSSPAVAFGCSDDPEPTPLPGAAPVAKKGRSWAKKAQTPLQPSGTAPRGRPPLPTVARSAPVAPLVTKLGKATACTWM